MKTLVLSLAAVPFLAGLASAAESLSNAQMDRVTAGFTIMCPGVGCSTSTVNGITTTTASADGFTIPVNASPGNLSAVLQAYFAFLSAQGFKPNPP